MYVGDSTGGVPGLQEKGKENKGNQHTMQKCFHGSKNIQMAAMANPVFDDYVFFFLLLNNILGGQ